MDVQVPCIRTEISLRERFLEGGARLIKLSARPCIQQTGRGRRNHVLAQEHKNPGIGPGLVPRFSGIGSLWPSFVDAWRACVAILKEELRGQFVS